MSIPFDLEQFKAGRPAITRDGRTADYLIVNDRGQKPRLLATIEGEYTERCWCIDGAFIEGVTSKVDLIAMAPQRLAGWINVYKDTSPSGIHPSREQADNFAAYYGSVKRIACIDLSQFEEGHGL